MKNKVRPFAVLLFTILLVVSFNSCGGGGGDDGEAIVSPAVNERGMYDLTDFLVEYSDGTTYTTGDLDVSGTMEIGKDINGNDTISQNFVISGTPIGVSGTYTKTCTNEDCTEGVFSISDASGTHDVSYVVSDLSLTTHSGVIDDPNTGLTFEEWDTWKKVSNTVASVVIQSDSEQIPESSFRWIGEVLIEKKNLPDRH